MLPCISVIALSELSELDVGLWDAREQAMKQMLLEVSSLKAKESKQVSFSHPMHLWC